MILKIDDVIMSGATRLVSHPLDGLRGFVFTCHPVSLQ